MEKAKYVTPQNVCRESSGAGSLSWIINTHFCALHFIDHCQAYSSLYSAIGPHNYIPMSLAKPKDSGSMKGICIGYSPFNIYKINCHLTPLRISYRTWLCSIWVWWTHFLCLQSISQHMQLVDTNTFLLNILVFFHALRHIRQCISWKTKTSLIENLHTTKWWH